MKAASVGRNVFFKNQSANFSVPVVKETKNGHAESGKAIRFDAKNDSFVVQNNKTGQLENWAKKDTTGLDSFINRKEKQINVAAQIISYQAAENEALKKENQALKTQIGQNLNKIG